MHGLRPLLLLRAWSMALPGSVGYAYVPALVDRVEYHVDTIEDHRPI
jgi:hypothetical protein